MVTRNGWTFVVFGAVCLVFGTWLQYAELIALGAGFLLCVALAAFGMGRRPPIEVWRDVVPSRVQEGERASGILTVTNQGRRRSPPILAVESFGAIGRSEVGSVVVALRGVAAGTSDSVAYPLPTDRRGRYSVGPLVVGNTDPLRLASGSQTYGAPASLLVHPRLHVVRPLPTGRAQDIEGPRSSRSPTGGSGFHSLREYAPGDDPRMIHWPSTAKDGQLKVRETAVTTEPRMLVVLDCSATSYGDDESFEDAVRIAASLVVAGADKGYPTDFHATSGASASIDSEGRGRGDALDQLASVQRGDDAGLSCIVAMATRNMQGVSVGIVTDQPARPAVAAVGQVGRRFGRVSLFQVGRRADREPIRISGVVGVVATTSTDFARTWNARFR